MTVRAKFKVQSVTLTEGRLATVVLLPVVGGSPENEQFYKYTPAGKIELSTVNSGAAAAFEPGGMMYVDFTRCELPPPAA